MLENMYRKCGSIIRIVSSKAQIQGSTSTNICHKSILINGFLSFVDHSQTVVLNSDVRASLRPHSHCKDQQKRHDRSHCLLWFSTAVMVWSFQTQNVSVAQQKTQRC